MLALLPDSELYAYINLKTVSQRSDLMEHVEFQLSHFVSLDELPFAEELLVSVGADALLLSTPFRTYQWAIVLLGDFTRLSDALRTSAESGGGLSVSIIDTHREIDIYALVRTKSTGRQSEIYLTVLDPETLAASPDADSAREIIDRHIDGGELPQGLAAMVEDWGLSDFLVPPLAPARASATKLLGKVGSPPWLGVFSGYLKFSPLSLEFSRSSMMRRNPSSKKPSSAGAVGCWNT